MLISEIKNKEVRELAEYYARTMPDASFGGTGNKKDLEEAFEWDDTPEGFGFWEQVLYGYNVSVPTTKKVEMKMPILPLGWHYTGEYRKSVKGTDYIYCDGKVVLSRGQELAYPIVVRISE